MTVTLAATAFATVLAGAFALGQFAPKQLQTEIAIDAPPSAVWQVLTQTEDYTDWNPFIRHLSGELIEGARVKATIEPPEGKAMTFAPTILTSKKDEELRWVGKLGITGIFDGEHYFILEQRADGGTLFRHGETFRGVLAHVLFALIGKQTEDGFDAMNRALKHKAETSA